MDGLEGRSLTNVRIARVLLWLLEFRFTSRTIITTICGLHRTRDDTETQRFFSKLKRDGVISEYKHSLLPREPLFMAGRDASQFAWAMLPAMVNSYSDFVHDTKLVMSNPSLLHDITVQWKIVRGLDEALLISSEYMLKKGGWGRNGICKIPDALVLNRSNHLVAIEYEATLKSRARIYAAFQQQVFSCQNRLYNYVWYVFPNYELCQKYRTLFDEQFWPIYEKDAIKGHMRRLDGVFDPGIMRRRFDFSVQACPIPNRFLEVGDVFEDETG